MKNPLGRLWLRLAQWQQTVDDRAAAWPWRWYHAALVFAVATAVIVVRRVDLVTHAQFWAEDGRLWFENAYRLGALWPLLIPVTGYFQTVSRLAGALAQLFPLKDAPLLFNLIAVTIKALPAVFLFSPRFRRVVPRFTARCALAAAYLCLPNTQELYANVTNAHSYLALLAFMTVVADKPHTWAEKIADGATYLLSGLSGAFVIFLLPVIGLVWLRENSVAALRRYWILLACGAVQTVTVFLNTSTDRSAMPLGATPWLLAKIVTVQVFFGPLFGPLGTLRLTELLRNTPGHWAYNALFVAVASAGVGTVAYAALKAKAELRLFLLFAGLSFATALLKPMASVTEPQWPVMAVPGNTERYWFFVSLAFLTCALWCLARGPRPVKVVAGALLAMSLVGLRTGFILPAWADQGFAQKAEEFSKLPARAVQVFPLMPAGWNMTLNKK